MVSHQLAECNLITSVVEGTSMCVRWALLEKKGGKAREPPELYPVEVEKKPELSPIQQQPIFSVIRIYNAPPVSSAVTRNMDVHRYQADR